MSDELLERLVDRVFLMGTMKGQIDCGKAPAYLSKNKAYLRYGRANVDKWIESGIVKAGRDVDPGKTRTVLRLSIMELETAAVKCNLLSELSPMAQEEMKGLRLQTVNG